MKTILSIFSILLLCINISCVPNQTEQDDHLPISLQANKQNPHQDSIVDNTSTSNALDPDDEEPRKDRQQWRTPQ